MPGPELTEEDIMLNDKDPMDALREIRREEGIAEEDLPKHDDTAGETDILGHDEIPGKDDGADDKSALDSKIGDGTDDAAAEQAAADKVIADKEVEDAAAAETAKAVKETTELADTAADASAADPDNKDLETAAAEAATIADDAKSGKVAKVDKVEKHQEKAVAAIRKFRANGQDFEFTEKEILDQFETIFGQSMNYTQKMQKIAPYRKMISALEEEGITHEQLNVAIDALKGDKGAIKKLMSDNKIDAYDLTAGEEENAVYAPKTYGKDETSLEIEEITSRIKGDKEFAITTNVIDEQWDSESRQVITKNPGLITGLHNDIKTGLYDKVAPAAMKMKVLDGNTKSDIEYYMLAGEQLRIQMEGEAKIKTGQSEVDELNKNAQGADDKFDKASLEAKRKRSANSTGTRADRKGVVDYLDDDDEAFDEWYKRIHST